MKRTTAAFASISMVLLLPAQPAQAQSTRTWVAGLGDDANPCALPAPCKTFAGALSKTAAGGEISVLDPGSFRNVTITKSISIIAEGSEGGISANASTGIVINAAATDVVYLHGLTIEGGGNGSAGIQIVSAGEVYIEKCFIKNFRGSPGSAIDILPAVAARVFVSNCTLVNNVNAIRAVPTGSGAAQILLDSVTIDNATNGVTAQGNSTFRMSNSVITGTTGAMITNGNGKVISWQNNAIDGNARNENTSSTISLK